MVELILITSPSRFETINRAVRYTALVVERSNLMTIMKYVIVVIVGVVSWSTIWMVWSEVTLKPAQGLAPALLGSIVVMLVMKALLFRKTK